MLNIKTKLTVTVVLILTLFLTVSINYASESNMEDSISLTDNTNDLEVSNDETTNVQADNNLKKQSATNGDSEELEENAILNISSLNNTINSVNSSEIVLEDDYIYDDNTDSAFISIGGIVIERDLTIDGKGHTIDLGGKIRFLQLTNHSITLKNLNIKNGYASQSGGAIYIDGGNGSFSNISFVGNIANSTRMYDGGGAVYIYRGNGIFNNTTFTGNKARQNGGGVFIYWSNSTFINTIFSNNNGENGAAVHIYKWGNSSFLNTQFTNNNASYRSGGVYIDSYCNISFSNATFLGNNASSRGGAVHIDMYSNVSFENSIFDSNNVEYSGGALDIFGGNGRFLNTEFKNNNANSTGGALFINYGGKGSFVNTTFTGNNGNTGGGAIYTKEGNISFISSTFTANNASSNGGVFNIVSGNITIDNSTFLNNNAINGSAFYLYDSNMYITNSTLTGNENPLWYTPISNVTMDQYTIDNSDKKFIYMNISAINFIYGYTAFLNISVYSNNGIVSEGIIYIIVNNKTYAVNVNQGTAIINISNLEAGLYNLDVIYNGTDNYYKFNTPYSLTVAKAKANITADIKDVVYGNDIIINITTTAEDSVAYVVINKTTYSCNITEKEGIISIPGLDPDFYELNLTYKETKNYNKTTILINFTVYKMNSTIDVSGDDIVYGENVLINVQTSCDDSVVYVIVNNKTFICNLTHGEGVINISGLDAGYYELNVTYNGSAYYNPCVKTVNFTVNKQTTTIKAPAAKFIANYGGQYKATVNTKVSGAIVSFTLKGKKIGSAKTDSSGTAKINIKATTLKNIGAGTYNLVVSFAGDKNHNGSKATAKIKINKENTKLINVKSVKKAYKSTARTMQLTATLKNSKNKPIKNQVLYFKINNKKTYKVKTNAKGLALLTLNYANIKACKLNKKGTYRFIVTYKTTKTYNKATKKGVLKVLK